MSRIRTRYSIGSECVRVSTILRGILFAPSAKETQMVAQAKISAPTYQLETVPERLFALKEAAKVIGAKEWQLRRAVKRGCIPSYTPFNSRKLVRLSEVVAYIDSCRQGGGE